MERLQHWLWGRLQGEGVLHYWRRQRFIRQVRFHEKDLRGLESAALVEQARTLGRVLRQQGFADAPVARMFALICEQAGRTLQMRHFDCQLIGGWIMLQGKVAEMQTGEGKTLTATLAVVTAALAGMPVHVISVNDYLTGRDAEILGPLYQAFGLQVGVISHEVPAAQRVAAYDADVLYITGKELVFDYLRDRMKLDHDQPLRRQAAALSGDHSAPEVQLRGLHFALVDEVDSVLIDESRTPLIISGSEQNPEQQQFIRQAWALAAELDPDSDYHHDENARKIELLDSGKEQIEHLSQALGSLWRGTLRREEVIHQALSALLLFRRDRDYLVREGKIELIDPLSGRVMEGRSWERGLHQMVELKESCELTDQRTTLARISYQSFFRRYLHLTGMTGTAREVRTELWDVYHLAVSVIPSHRPCQRRSYQARVFESSEARWQAVAEQARVLTTQGRAVLIGTHSVEASELASQHLQGQGIAHQILNAKQDEYEAAVVEQAGQPGRVTVATNMAGRGTDIKLAPSVTEAGGLHVILTEHYESGRVDRQLAGRGARQGDPGSFEGLLALDAVQFCRRGGRFLARSAAVLGVDSGPGRYLALTALKREQDLLERQNHRARKATLHYDQRQNELLAFSGRLD